MAMKFSTIGRLTKDIELRYTQGSNPTAVGRFSIATNRKQKDKDGNYPTDFFNCVAFGKLAEVLEKHVHKGNQVVLYGVIQNDNYTDKNGNQVYSFAFIVNDFDFCDNNKSASQQSVPQQNVPQQNVPQQNVPQQSVPQQSAPQQSVPQQSVPQQSVPQQSVPQQSVPQYAQPQDDGFINIPAGLEEELPFNV